MAGTKAGAKKAAAKLLERNPNYYSDLGRRGGKNSNNGGFASNVVGEDGLTGRQRAQVAGKKGGHTSRRGPNKQVEEPKKRWWR